MDKDNKKEEEILKNFLFDETLSEEEMTSRQWKILEAAVKVFSEKGFDGSRTSDIAREANVAEGTIFRYYKTKKDLLLGLLLPMTAKFFRPLALKSVEKIVNSNQDKPAQQVFEEILIDRLILVKKNLPLVKTVLVESIYHPELMEPIKKEIMPTIIAFVDKLMQQHIDNGDFRDIEPRILTRTFISSLMGYIMLTNAFPDYFTCEDEREEMRRLADILINGIKSR